MILLQPLLIMIMIKSLFYESDIITLIRHKFIQQRLTKTTNIPYFHIPFSKYIHKIKVTFILSVLRLQVLRIWTIKRLSPKSMWQNNVKHTVIFVPCASCSLGESSPNRLIGFRSYTIMYFMEFNSSLHWFPGNDEKNLIWNDAILNWLSYNSRKG